MVNGYVISLCYVFFFVILIGGFCKNYDFLINSMFMYVFNIVGFVELR